MFNNFDLNDKSNHTISRANEGVPVPVPVPLNNYSTGYTNMAVHVDFHRDHHQEYPTFAITDNAIQYVQKDD